MCHDSHLLPLVNPANECMVERKNINQLKFTYYTFINFVLI